MSGLVQLVDDRGEEDVLLGGEVLRHALHARGLVHVVGLAAEEVDERAVHRLEVLEREPALDARG